MDRELAADHVLADVEGGRVALADEGHAAPRGGAPHRGHARVRITRAVHRGLDALAVRELAQCRDRIRLLRVHDRLGTDLAREREPLGGDVDRDHARAHRASEQGGAEPHRPLAEDRERVAARDVQTLERAVGGPGAARDRRALLERDGVRHGHQREGRHLHEGRMGAVAGHAVDGDAVAAELRPAGAAVLAPAAALVVMVHHAAADQRRIDAGADGVHDAARLVAADDGRAGAP